MRILLTGATGQVGAALRAPLASAGSLVVADRNRLDLARPENVTAVLDDIAPDLIVNPAAYTAVDRAEDERELAFRVNAEAPGARWHGGRRGEARVRGSPRFGWIICRPGQPHPYTRRHRIIGVPELRQAGTALEYQRPIDDHAAPVRVSMRSDDVGTAGPTPGTTTAGTSRHRLAETRAPFDGRRGAK
jgi:hypothetical protein